MKLSDEQKLAVFDQVYAALEEAAAHLDYCGYGDSWERECARESKLRGRIEAAIEAGAPPPAPPPEVFVCQHCGREFKSVASRRQHRKNSAHCRPAAPQPRSPESLMP